MNPTTEEKIVNKQILSCFDHQFWLNFDKPEILKDNGRKCHEMKVQDEKKC